MPLIVDGPQIPTRWLERKPATRIFPINSRTGRDESLRIALINNMPDSALEDTEFQFFSLLDDSSGDLPVIVKLYSLTGISRTERGMQHLNSFYVTIDELWNSQFDAVIMTGTEPYQPDLKQEPYWHNLVNVLDWAERNTFSTILSCLAAHAGVLHTDGIERQRLGDKQFGVFEFSKRIDHALIRRTAQTVRFPHSRWNEAPTKALTSCGYSVLTHSPGAGADCFVKQKKKSLFVHFQGHPEYGEQTLLKEYRRDIRRYLRKERETYPTMPQGYFNPQMTSLLSDFRETAVARGEDGVMTAFPETILVETLEHSWRSSALCIYRNWLHQISEKKSETRCHVPVRVERNGNALRLLD